jgi:high-affinity nickel-transport protein
MYGFIVALHLSGWGLFLYYQHRFGVVYAGAGGLAYSFGMRHAFDADHISAIDDTTRYLMQRGKKPLGVGFFFSLGHSTIVLSLALAAAVAASGVERHLPALRTAGGTIGSTISGTFLIAIGIVDLVILRGILDVWKKAKSGEYRQAELDDLMMQRGFINRVMGSRWRRFISDSWQMYPVGMLFGLGFDTASEIGLLALTGAAATGRAAGRATGLAAAGHAAAGHPSYHLSVLAVVALPLLFAAGMSLMDTTDGVVMVKAYDWAFKNPLRKVYYNMSTVALGVFVALGVGLVEYLQVFSTHAGLTGGVWDWVKALNFEFLGYFIIGSFVVLWLASMGYYRWSRVEERYAGRGQ